MANSYVVACKKCKKGLDVGTYRGIYFLERPVMEELSDFMVEHSSHELIFDNWECFDGIEESETEDSDEEYRPSVFKFSSYVPIIPLSDPASSS
jgi:hypothetical protein